MGGPKLKFEYFDNSDQTVEKIVGKVVFEDQLTTACGQDHVSEVSVQPLTPGLSGAAVFLIRRIGANGAFAPWVVKACKDPEIIIAERNNYTSHIENVLPRAPKLIQTGSSNLLIFPYGAYLSNPKTLRTGYALSTASTLKTLMERIVESLQNIHHFQEDTAACLQRMPLKDLEQRLRGLNPPLSEDVLLQLCNAWKSVSDRREEYPRIRSSAHGDLNAGNVLFDPGSAASYPLFIDFASMVRSKDNTEYPDGFHLPFWDYAKLERDIQTRMFLKEAINEKLDKESIIGAIRFADGTNQISPPSPSINKLMDVTFTLRKNICNVSVPNNFTGCYRTVLAYAMLSVLLRETPDADLDAGLQHLVAAEAAIALLKDPFVDLPLASVGSSSANPPTDSISARDFGQLSADERMLVTRLFKYDGLCKISKPRNEYECLWVPGAGGIDMQWGWERTDQEVADSGKARGSRIDRLKWIYVVEGLVKKGLLRELPKEKEGQKARLFELTEEGTRAGFDIARETKA
jgi:hypothetical protein